MRTTATLLTLLLFAACGSSKPPAPDPAAADANVPRTYSSALTSSPVGVIPVATLKLPQGDRSLELAIDYPTRSGANPVIVFSHDYASSGRGYVGLSSYWAGNGYVVIRPTHADGRRTVATAASGNWALQETATDWRNRVADVTFILDNLATLEKDYPELQGKIDHERIGVAGHGYGAFTAMLAGGMRITAADGRSVNYADARIDAVIAMSPQGPSTDLGITRESWTEMKEPVLFLTGSQDSGATDSETPEWRRQAFELAPAGDKWLVSIAGARRLTFAGGVGELTEAELRALRSQEQLQQQRDPQTPVRGPGYLVSRDRSLFALAQTVSLAFWDSYLKKESEGGDYLRRLEGRSDASVTTK